jgi:cyanophycinase
MTAAVLCSAFAAAQEMTPSGHLILIGGGEKPAAAMRKFVELAGGPSAPIVAIPTASGDPETPAYYLDLFGKEYGCSKVEVLEIRSREDAARTDYADIVAKARGIFFSGGDQSRITKAMLDTPVGDAVADAFARGAVVGGTSAGMACQSALMITGVGDFSLIRANNVELVRGLGLIRGAIVDQHSIARKRLNRLISVILEHPDLLGIGVDEDTAVWVRPDGTFEVMGAGSVLVLDASASTVTRHPAEDGKDVLGARDLLFHILLPGQGFDLGSRAVLENEPAREMGH